VVKEEKKKSYDNRPYGQLLSVVYGNEYTVYPYKWTTIGNDQYINQATLPEFMNFYKTFYVPNNAVLVIGGDIDVAKTKEMITKYYGDIPKGTKEIPRPTAVEPAQKAEKKVTFYDNVQLPAIILAYHIPQLGTDDYYAVQLLTQLLSQGKSSRFEKEIVDKQQKAVQTAAFDLQNEAPGLAIMLSIASQGVKPEELEKSMVDEVEKVKTTLISEEEYQKLMNQAESDFIEQNQKVLGVVNHLATYYTFNKDANLINTELDRYKKISREDLKRVANKYFTKDNRLVVYYLPKAYDKKEKTEEAKAESAPKTKTISTKPAGAKKK
jgi:predicted Zn-dependent peptidase